MDGSKRITIEMLCFQLLSCKLNLQAAKSQLQSNKDSCRPFKLNQWLYLPIHMALC
jgi:hypothetical protein